MHGTLVSNGKQVIKWDIMGYRSWNQPSLNYPSRALYVNFAVVYWCNTQNLNYTSTWQATTITTGFCSVGDSGIHKNKVQCISQHSKQPPQIQKICMALLPQWVQRDFHVKVWVITLPEIREGGKKECPRTKSQRERISGCKCTPVNMNASSRFLFSLPLKKLK